LSHGVWYLAYSVNNDDTSALDKLNVELDYWLKFRPLSCVFNFALKHKCQNKTHKHKKSEYSNKTSM